ncbi:MAG: CGGC domain-containing protein [bacterium]
MLKVGIIRCRQTEDLCPGNTDFKVAKNGKCAFEETGPVEIVGFLSCGGCPGKKVPLRAQMMVDKGAEIIAFGSCMGNGNPIDYSCPHFDKIKSLTRQKLDSEIQIFDWTH